MARGEGYLRKRGKTWYFEFMYKGRRYYEKIGNVSKTVAKEIANEIRSRIIKGEYIPTKIQNITFQNIAQQYIEWYMSKSNARNRTKAEHKRQVQRLVEYFGRYKLQDITYHVIESYKSKRLSDGVSHRTVNYELTILKSIFNRAKDRGFINDIPNIEKFPNADKEIVRYLSREEAERLISACPEWFKPIVIFALNTGLRAGEIFSLRWEHVDLDNKVLYVEARNTKTKKVYKIPMNDTVYKLLKTLILNKKEHGFVFTNRFGKPYKYEDSTYRKTFKRACEKAGIKNFRFHDLRHTFASWVAMKSKDLYALEKLLSHSSPEVTKRYAHLTDDYLRQVINSISDFGSFSAMENEKVRETKAGDGT